MNNPHTLKQKVSIEASLKHNNWASEAIPRSLCGNFENFHPEIDSCRETRWLFER